MYEKIYLGQSTCLTCNKVHTQVNLDNSVTISNFSYNFYIPDGKCSYPDEDRYCVLVKWNDFIQEPEKYIEQAYAKRDQPISKKLR